MGFFKDLLSSPKPCDVCSVGAAGWSHERTAMIDWSLRGAGLNVKLRICPVCAGAINSAGLGQKNPVMAVVVLACRGLAPRPPVHAYLQHPEWRKVWMHTLEQLGMGARDEFAALAAMKQVEERLFQQAAAGNDVSCSRQLHDEIKQSDSTREDRMGLLSRPNSGQSNQSQQRLDPYARARNEVWARETARLGRQEFQRRLSAVSDYQLGRGPASGFEEWERQMQAEIMRRAQQLASEE